MVLDALWDSDRLRSVANGHVAIVYQDKEKEDCSDETKLLAGFEAREVWIALCDGPVETWKVLDKITLYH